MFYRPGVRHPFHAFIILLNNAETLREVVDVWGVKASYGEERAEGELGKDKDDGD